MPRIFSAMNSHHSAFAVGVEQQVGVVARELREAGAVPHLLEERAPLVVGVVERRAVVRRVEEARSTDVFSISRIASKSARSCACSSAVIGALLSGVHQLAVRWYTVSDATSSAIDGDDLHAARPGADDRDPLAREVDRRRRPPPGVVLTRRGSRRARARRGSTAPRARRSRRRGTAPGSRVPSPSVDRPRRRRLVVRRPTVTAAPNRMWRRRSKRSTTWLR